MTLGNLAILHHRPGILAMITPHLLGGHLLPEITETILLLVVTMMTTDVALHLPKIETGIRRCRRLTTGAVMPPHLILVTVAMVVPLPPLLRLPMTGMTDGAIAMEIILRLRQGPGHLHPAAAMTMTGCLRGKLLVT